MRGVILAGLFLAAAGAASAQTPAPAPTPPPVREIARGVYLQPGALYPDRGPDGNSVIFEAPNGFVVVDTGRHPWHADALIAFARERNKRIFAIFNTHWHLDHSSGNARLRAAFPDADVFTTNAIDRALTTFIARNLERARQSVGTATGTRKEETELFLATMEHPETLRGGNIVSGTSSMRFPGHHLDVRVTDRAVTDADLWLYDRNTRVAVLGDLVTLPSPFFETACPDQWGAALDAVWATPFRVAIPGHGEPMTRAQFDLYRRAFNAFMDCVRSERGPAECAGDWANTVDPLLGAPGMAHADALQYAEYYVGFLRQNGGASAECLAAAPARG